MKKEPNYFLENCRILQHSQPKDGIQGVFSIPIGKMTKLFVVSSNKGGWDHVSVSVHNRTPTWEEMEIVKNLFFEEDETVFQFHPKSSEYKESHVYCLHLWKQHNKEIELPPQHMVR